MFRYEKELEDYICDNQEEFIETISELYPFYAISFVGRQMHIGDSNIADLIYYAQYMPEIADKNDVTPNTPIEELDFFLIVELKNNPMDSKDIAQLSRYINVLSKKLYKEKASTYEVRGLLVGKEPTSIDMKHLIRCNLFFSSDFIERIKFLSFSSIVKYSELSYDIPQEYISDIILDERFNYYLETDEKEVKDNGSNKSNKK